MSRSMLCQQCGDKYSSGINLLLPPSSLGEPAEFSRVCKGNALLPQPEQRVITINGTRIPLEPDIWTCDDCVGDILPGEPAVCRTIWAGTAADAPPSWETDFISVEDSAIAI